MVTRGEQKWERNEDRYCSLSELQTQCALFDFFVLCLLSSFLWKTFEKLVKIRDSFECASRKRILAILKSSKALILERRYSFTSKSSGCPDVNPSGDSNQLIGKKTIFITY